MIPVLSPMVKSDWLLVPLSGKDIIPYLNRRCTQLITAEAIASKECITHFLTPTGKICFTCGLLYGPDQQIYCELHAAAYEHLKQDFETYVFNEDISILPPIACHWANADYTLPSPLFHSIGIGYRLSSPTSLSLKDIESTRILHKIPLFPIDYSSHLSALDSDVIRAICFQKGCYPGQEVISKTIHLGKAPYRLYWYQGDDMPKITQDHGGQVTSSYTIEKAVYGFVKLKRSLDIGLISETYDIEITPHAFSKPLPKD